MAVPKRRRPTLRRCRRRRLALARPRQLGPERHTRHRDRSIIQEWTDPVLSAWAGAVEVRNPSDQRERSQRLRHARPHHGRQHRVILRTRSANELLGVLAHEAGHIKNRHTLRDGAQGAGMQPMLMTMALGALAIAAGAPDAGAVLLGNSQYFGTLSALRYMTHQEGEADNTGARALEAAGQSGRGLVSFFENFRSQEVFSDARRYPYFRSHPLSSTDRKTFAGSSPSSRTTTIRTVPNGSPSTPSSWPRSMPSWMSRTRPCATTLKATPPCPPATPAPSPSIATGRRKRRWLRLMCS